jgi:hypothetical protein
LEKKQRDPAEREKAPAPICLSLTLVITIDSTTGVVVVVWVLLGWSGTISNTPTNIRTKEKKIK